MNKKIVIFSVTMLSVIFLSSCFSKDENSTSSNTNSNLAVETSAPAPDVAQVEVEEDIVILGPGFVEYDESVIGEVENTVLFFHQESCSTCKTTEADLIANGLPVDTQVLKIDIDADSSTELKQKYGVTMKHTFVQVDANGEMIKKWNGSLSGQDIIDKVNESKDAMMEKSEDEAMMKKDEEVMEKEDEAMMKKDEEKMMDKTDTATQETVEASVELAGTYANYDSSLVGKNDTTVLAFFAPWCPSCVAADKAITAGSVPDGLSILKADFDSSTDLRKKYGVTGQHTFVQVDANGELVKKWVGGNSIQDIVSKVQ